MTALHGIVWWVECVRGHTDRTPLAVVMLRYSVWLGVREDAYVGLSLCCYCVGRACRYCVVTQSAACVDSAVIASWSSVRKQLQFTLLLYGITVILTACCLFFCVF